MLTCLPLFSSIPSMSSYIFIYIYINISYIQIIHIFLLSLHQLTIFTSMLPVFLYFHLYRPCLPLFTFMLPVFLYFHLYYYLFLYFHLYRSSSIFIYILRVFVHLHLYRMSVRILRPYLSLLSTIAKVCLRSYTHTSNVYKVQLLSFQFN